LALGPRPAEEALRCGLAITGAAGDATFSASWMPRADASEGIWPGTRRRWQISQKRRPSAVATGAANELYLYDLGGSHHGGGQLEPETNGMDLE
jgi:hypothetical protein